MAHTARFAILPALAVTLALGATGGAAGARDGAVPDAAAWVAAARSGAPLDVSLAGRPLRLQLRQDASLFAPGAEIRDADGRAVDRSAIHTLTGSAAGHPGSVVRVTAGPASTVGFVWLPDGTSIVLGPDAEGATVAVASDRVAEALAARGSDTTIEPESPEAGAEECDSLLWVPRVAAPASLLQENQTRTFNVAFAVDQAFAAAHPDWATLATGFVNAVDALFEASFQIGIQIEHLIALPLPAITGDTTTEMLAELQDYYVEHYPDLERENVHLFTGGQPTNAAGQVNCVGSVGRTTLSYSVSDADPGGNFDFFGLRLLPDGAMKIAAHELAHTLSAHHHYANCVETAPAYQPLITLDACTVMINDWGLIHPTFSSLSRLTVRGWASYYDV